MITCTLEIHNNIDDLYKIFSSEIFKSKRAECTITKGKTLKFDIKANDSISMKAFLNSILKIIETHDKISRVK